MRRLISITVLLTLICAALSVGASHVENLWSALLHPGSNVILWDIRIPRVIATVIVGAALGVAGLIAQGACNNPLAEPSILGTSAGASLGAVVAILTGIAQVGSIGAIVCGALGALCATAITFKLASLRGNLSSFALVIVGIAVSAILTAVVGVASVMVTRADARSISFWSFGSFALITQENLIGLTLFTIIGLVIAYRIAPMLDRLSLGDATAFHLGVDVSRARFLSLISISLLAGGAVSTVGSVAFIGLAAPHIARFIYGPQHRQLVVESAIIGSALVIVADTLCRTIAQPNELPIGLITSFIGAPVLIALVTVHNNVWRSQ